MSVNAQLRFQRSFLRALVERLEVATAWTAGVERDANDG
jgi:hypothetical protein